MSTDSKIVFDARMVNRNALQAALLLLICLSGCANAKGQLFTVHVVAQNAPVQIVSVTAGGDNLLAHVVVKNLTDNTVQSFTFAWTIIQPKNCGASPWPAKSVTQEVRSVYGEADRPLLLPHKQEEIRTLLLTRRDMEKLAQANHARKLRIQILVAYLDFLPENAKPESSVHVGPDWQSSVFDTSRSIFDKDDAAQQACGQ